MVRRKIYLILAFLLWTTFASGEQVRREDYITRPGDALSDLLLKRGLGKSPEYPLYGRQGWLARNTAANKHIRKWNHLKGGEKLQLVLPAVPGKIATLEKPSPEKSASQAPVALRPTPTPEGKPAAQEIIFEKRLLIGVTRANLSETLNADVTKTGGLWSLPRLSAEFLGWTAPGATESYWKYGFRGSLARIAPLNGIAFPVAWSAALGVLRQRFSVWGPDAATELSPFMALGVESFAQASPDRSRVFAVLPFKARTNLLLWLEFGAELRTSFLGHWTEILAALLFSPYTRSSFDLQSDLSLLGFGGDLRFRQGLYRGLFGQVELKAFHLSGNTISLTGNSADFALGFQF